MTNENLYRAISLRDTIRDSEDGIKYLDNSDHPEALKTALVVYLTVIEDKSELDDFRDMKGFKSFIIANSSFSAMAAHLGEHPEKKVVAPKLWFGEQAVGMDASDIYNQNWIVI